MRPRVAWLAAVIGCGRPAADVAAPVAPATDDAQTLIERGPFLLLEFAREAIGRRDFTTAARQVDEHRRLAAEAWRERIDVELVVACWRGDAEALAGLTRRYAAELCPRVDEEIRPQRRGQAVEAMCFGVGVTPWGAAARVDSDACRRTVEATYAAIDAG